MSQKYGRPFWYNKDSELIGSDIFFNSDQLWLILADVFRHGYFFSHTQSSKSIETVIYSITDLAISTSNLSRFFGSKILGFHYGNFTFSHFLNCFHEILSNLRWYVKNKSPLLFSAITHICNSSSFFLMAWQLYVFTTKI